MFDSDKFLRLSGREAGRGHSEAFSSGLAGIGEAEEPLLPDDERAQRVLAALEATFLMIAVDGRVMEEEEDAARSVLHELVSAHLGPGQIEELLAAFAERLDAEGLGARLEAVGRALREDRGLCEETFGLCAAVTAADGKEASEENEGLNELLDRLGLDDERADELLGEVRSRLSPAA